MIDELNSQGQIYVIANQGHSSRSNLSQLNVAIFGEDSVSCF